VKGFILPRRLGKLAEITASDSTRLAMQSIRVKATWEGCRLDATNGKTLVIVRVDTTNPDGPSPLDTFLISADDWRSIFKMGGRKPVTLSAEGHTWIAQSGEYTVRGNLHEGRFPNTDSVLPTRNPLVSIYFDADVLTSAIKAVATCAPPEKEKEAAVIRLQVYAHSASGAPIGIVAMNSDTIVDALVMPMTPPAKQETPEKRRRGKDVG
jgi:DNA polymerase III sliding clamp (beta) subunit (PCNA family)